MADSENKTSDKMEQSGFQENGADYEAVARDIKEGRLSSFVGEGTSLDGELNFRVMARVDGHLTGRVTSEKGTLNVGASGQVDAVVSVAVAIINGTVNGDVTTSEHLELKRTAKIVGNIRTPRLIMEDGAVLEGNCSMLKAEEKAENRPAKQFAPASGAATTAGAPAVRSNPVFAREEQAKDKKPLETGGKNEESSKLTLEVV